MVLSRTKPVLTFSHLLGKEGMKKQNVLTWKLKRSMICLIGFFLPGQKMSDT